MNKSLKKAQISDLYLALLTHVRPLCVSSYSADDKLKVLPQEEQIQLVVTKVDNLVTKPLIQHNKRHYFATNKGNVISLGEVNGVFFEPKKVLL